jgi:hypothetical protein
MWRAEFQAQRLRPRVPRKDAQMDAALDTQLE